MTTLFWLCAGALLYPLVIYPGFMALVGMLRSRRLLRGTYRPSVALIVAACNEERHIRAMMEQLLVVDYPRELLELVVASDMGSTDATHAIVREYADRGIRLCLPTPGEVGKNVSLDAAVAATHGEILVFADATAIWRHSAIGDLVAGFADGGIGCISARKAYWLEDGFGPHSYRSYWSVEGLVDRGSSLLGYVPNASGGLHALRRSIYRSVPGFMIRDLVDPAQAIGAGYDVALDPEVTYDDAPWVGAREVYRARVRITMRALSSTHYILGQLWQGRRPISIWQYVSHKLLRWLMWLPAAGLFATSLALAPQSRWFTAAAAAQLLLYAMVPLAPALARRGREVAALSAWTFFVLNILAMAQGSVAWLLGRQKTTWRLSPKGAGAVVDRTA
jgi:cellulose synthase/poly-beta-1,6-N-acetylglucosamine synthase-like glycosyltransferase